MGCYEGRCAVRVLINRREPTLSSGSMRSLGSDASRFKASIGGRQISFVFLKPYGEIRIERQRHKKPDLTAKCIVLLLGDRLPLTSLPPSSHPPRTVLVSPAVHPITIHGKDRIIRRDIAGPQEK